MNIAGLQEQCYELSFVLEIESPNEGDYFFGNFVHRQENDLCLPLDSDVRTLSRKVTTLSKGNLVTGTYLLCCTDLYTGRRKYALFIRIEK